MGEKSAKKAKKEKEQVEAEAPAEAAVERKTMLCPIAKPLADDKLSKKVGGCGDGILMCMQRTPRALPGPLATAMQVAFKVANPCFLDLSRRC